MTTPVSPSSGQPPSFKTNVNRAKTKRWVEAKSYSYDGDDWGEEEDEDDYSNPAPPSASARSHGGFEGPYPQPPGGRHGDAPIYPNAPHSMRGVSNPSPGLSRAKPTFDPPDERRTYSLTSQGGFSDGPYPSGGRPPFVPPFVPPDPHGPGPKSRTPRNQSPLRVDTGQRRPSMGQDHYPHAPVMLDPASGRPQPQFRPDPRGGAYPDMRGVGPYPGPRGGPYAQPRPGPYGDPRGRPVGPYAVPPGRRSQSSGRPPMSDIVGHSGSPSRGPYGTPPPGVPPMPGSNRGSEEGSRDSSPAKKFPPRKSSLSQEQAPNDIPGITNDSRSSPDNVEGKPATPKALPFIRPADIYKRMEEERERVRRQSEESSQPSIDGSGGVEPPALHQRGSNDSLGRSAERHIPDEFDSNRRLKPSLGTVTERKSEYGFDNILQGANSDHPSVESNPQHSRPDAKEPSSASSTYSNRPDPVTASTIRSQASLGPLPEVGRVSDFGDELFRPQSGNQSPAPASSEALTPKPPFSVPRRFDSAVNQAFDDSQNRGPDTPASSSGNSVLRSNSANTSDISPIISRQSSSAAAEPRQPAAPVEPTIYEEPAEGKPRSESSGTVVALQHQSKSPDDDKELPQPPKSGFRRNTDSPSPSDSPARRPLSVITQEIAPSNSAIVASPISGNSDKPLPEIKNGSRTPSPVKRAQLESASRNSPIPRAESPTKGTVKDIANRFETVSDRSSPVGSPERQSGTSRPSDAWLESFRPSLPGGWNSYTTNEGGSVSTPGLARETSLPSEPTLAEIGQLEAQPQDRGEDGRDPSLVHTPLAQDDQDSSAKAFAEAAAAGSALAVAFSAATGRNGDEPDTPPESRRLETPSDALSSADATPGTQADERDTSYLKSGLDTVREEATSKGSSAPPTPPPKDQDKNGTPRLVSNDQSYFPSPLRTGRSRSPDDHLITPRRPDATPALSTETSPQDSESDRLRKEIFKSFTPRVSNVEEELDAAARLPEKNSSPSQTVVPKDIVPEAPSSPQGLEASTHNLQVAEKREQGLPEEQSRSQERDVTRPTLRKRFSWETESELNESPVVTTSQPPFAPSTDQTHNPSGDSWRSNDQPSQNVRETVSDAMDITSPALSSPVQARRTSFGVGVYDASGPRASDQFLSTENLPEPEVRDTTTEQQLSQPTYNKNEPQIIPFRNILAMNGTEDRIKAYNHARDQFSSTETGLLEWIQAMGQNLPEHSNMIVNNAPFSAQDAEGILGHKVSPSRSKFPRIVPLDASTQQSGDGSSRPTAETSMGERTEQLLLKAEKFGGKAGGMAKGLFAKGKSRFRGSGGGDKAFFGYRRKSQPQVVVADETPHSRQLAVPQMERSASPADNTSTWSLSYAPTEPNRSSEEKPPIPQQLGSLAPPPYSGTPSSESRPTNINEEDGSDQRLARPASPHVSALGSTEGRDGPSRTVSQMTRPTASDDRSPISFGDGPDLRLSLSSPIDGGASCVQSVPKAKDEEHTDSEPRRHLPSPNGVMETPQRNSEASDAHVEQLKNTDTLNDGVNDGASTTYAIVEQSEKEASQATDSVSNEMADPEASKMGRQTSIDVGLHGNVSDAGDVTESKVIPREKYSTLPAIEETSQMSRRDDDRVQGGIPQLPKNGQATNDAPAGLLADSSAQATEDGKAVDEDALTNRAPVSDQPIEPVLSAEASHQSEEQSETRPRPFSFVGTDAPEVLNLPRDPISGSADPEAQADASAEVVRDQIPGKKHSRSFSRPFDPPQMQRPSFQEHQAYSASLDRNWRSQSNSTGDWHSVSQPNSMARPSYIPPRLPTPEEEPYRIPGPYGQSFKSPIQGQSWTRAPPPLTRMSQSNSEEYLQGYQSYRQPLSQEQPYGPRPLNTEYSLPGVEAPPVPTTTAGRRRSGFFGANRSRPKSQIQVDDDSDVEEPRHHLEKRRSGFLRKKSRRASESAASQQTNRNHTRKGSTDALRQMMSPVPVGIPENKQDKKGKKLNRASTAESDPAETRKRGSFSRLSGLFGRSSKPPISPAQDHPSKPTQLADRREPMLPALLEQRQPTYQDRPASEIRDQPPHCGGNYTLMYKDIDPGHDITVPVPKDGSYEHQTYNRQWAAVDMGRSQDPNTQYPSFSQHHQMHMNNRNHANLPSLRIDTSGNGNHHTYQHRPHCNPGQQQPHAGPARNSPYETTKSSAYQPDAVGPGVGAKQESLQYAIDLHRKSRSPTRGRPNFDCDEEEMDHGPASQLGTFTASNRPRDGQEAPWHLDLPQEDSRRRSNFYPEQGTNGHDSGVHLNRSNSHDPARPSGLDGNDNGSYDNSGDQHLPPPGIQAQLYEHGQDGGISSATRRDGHQVHELQGSRPSNYPPSEVDEEIVMSPTSYPGQEWIPKIDFGRGSSPGLRSWEHLPDTNIEENQVSTQGVGK